LRKHDREFRRRRRDDFIGYTIRENIVEISSQAIRKSCCADMFERTHIARAFISDDRKVDLDQDEDPAIHGMTGNPFSAFAALVLTCGSR